MQSPFIYKYPIVLVMVGYVCPKLYYENYVRCELRRVNLDCKPNFSCK